MRVASKTIYDNVTANLRNVYDQMAKANQVVSTGKKLNHISDDPLGLVTVLGLRASIENVEQLEKNISQGKAWMNMREATLTQTHDTLVELKSLALEMANATQGASERSSAAKTVDGLMRQILGLANTQVDGKYIFAGNKTDSPPFVHDENGVPPSVSYQGNATSFAIKIGKDNNLAVGTAGRSIFGDDSFDWSDPAAGDTNIFKTLMDLKTHLESNDVAGIQGSLDKLDSHFETVRQGISECGTKTIRLETKESILADLKITYTERKSHLEDADIAEAILELTAAETVYQAALASSARVMNISLADFI